MTTESTPDPAPIFDSLAAQPGRPDIRDLIERSSLGTPGAKALRESVSDEQVAKVMARLKARELEALDADLDDASPDLRRWASAADTICEHATEAEARSHEANTRTVHRWPDGPWLDDDGHVWEDDPQMDALRAERDQAIAHDRQPYPTALAYGAARREVGLLKAELAAAQELPRRIQGALAAYEPRQDEARLDAIRAIVGDPPADYVDEALQRLTKIAAAAWRSGDHDPRLEAIRELLTGEVDVTHSDQARQDDAAELLRQYQEIQLLRRRLARIQAAADNPDLRDDVRLNAIRSALVQAGTRAFDTDEPAVQSLRQQVIDLQCELDRREEVLTQVAWAMTFEAATDSERVEMVREAMEPGRDVEDVPDPRGLLGVVTQVVPGEFHG